jgi:hypothetical protein
MSQAPRIFWNLSNHRLADAWSPAQAEAARVWEGLRLEPRDFPFPPVDPEAKSEAVQALAEATLRGLEATGARPGEPVLVMGEFTLAFELVGRLAQRGLVPVTATTRRDATQQLQPDGSVSMVHQFRFVRFRRYGMPMEIIFPGSAPIDWWAV